MVRERQYLHVDWIFYSITIHGINGYGYLPINRRSSTDGHCMEEIPLQTDGRSIRNFSAPIDQVISQTERFLKLQISPNAVLRDLLDAIGPEQFPVNPLLIGGSERSWEQTVRLLCSEGFAAFGGELCATAPDQSAHSAIPTQLMRCHLKIYHS
jgi:hypothetical protein